MRPDRRFGVLRSVCGRTCGWLQISRFWRPGGAAWSAHFGLGPRAGGRGGLGQPYGAALL